LSEQGLRHPGLSGRQPLPRVALSGADPADAGMLQALVFLALCHNPSSLVLICLELADKLVGLLTSIFV
jgi:hypothetical protein